MASSGHLLGPFGVTLHRQIGLPGAVFKARRKTQTNVVLSLRPAPLIHPNGRLASTACTFKQTRAFVISFVSFQHNVVVGPRMAPSVYQNGLLASTACTFLHRLICIMFGRFQKNMRTSAAGGPMLGRLGCLLEAPGRRRHPKGIPRTRFESSGLSLRGPWPSSEDLPAPKGTPKALQGRNLGRLG